MEFHSVFDVGILRNEFENAGINLQFIPSIWKHVRQKPEGELDEIPSLPGAAYAILRSKFKAMTSSLISYTNSRDSLTTKLLIRLQNRNLVEAVIMRYDPRLGKYDGKTRPGCQRSTLCVSSQVGCKMACKFCATGTMGFKINLSAGEIVEQLVHASYFSEIRNIVFMGMGEPLNNYSAVVDAIQIMTGSPFQLSPKRITVSTVGIIHAIKKFHDSLPNVNLAVSLHASDQDIRCQIMPSARAFPLGKLIEALQTYQEKSRQKIFIEYIMLNGVNDLEQHAHRLGNLLQALEVVVNLIPFNPIGSSGSFTQSTEQNVKAFQRVLRGTFNIRTTIRQQMGEDISGACGQLVVNHSEKIPVNGESLLADIEDLHIH